MRVEVVMLDQPQHEVLGFVLPGFTKWDAFEFAERLFHFASSDLNGIPDATHSFSRESAKYVSDAIPDDDS